jgi:hypothetical protein
LIQRTLDIRPAVARGVMRAARDALAHGPLTLASRDQLVSRCARLGLSRFEATLLIASAERSVRHSNLSTHVGQSSRLFQCISIMTAIGLQCCITAGVWWLVRS